MNIAFFDFDGTITSKDSMIDFIIYTAGYRKFFTGMIQLIPHILMYKLGIIENWQAKEKVINKFWGGWVSSTFEETAVEYSKKKLPLIIRGKAVEAIKTHKQNGDKVVVVSASCEKWLKPWCDFHNIELIGTIIEISNDTVTGKISGKNCYGAEKVVRIKQKYTMSDYGIIYAYGDSTGDKEMLKLAHVKYYKWKPV